MDPARPPAARPDDDVEALAAAAAAGDRRALDTLLARIRPEVLARCRRFLSNPADAEEACQDSLLAVANKITTFEGRSKFRTWLYRVCANSSLNAYRKLRRRSVEGPPIMELPSELRTSVIAGNRVVLFDALDKLPDHLKEPAVLRDVAGLDYAEIAAQMGIPLGTVKSRLHEARAQMRRSLQEDAAP